MGRGFGRIQARILVAVWRATEAGFAERCWGVPWGRLLPPNRSRSFCAAVSRALKRLEDRGLVRRRNKLSGDKHQQPVEFAGRVRIPDPPPAHHRSTHVLLTDEGLAIARTLAEQRAMR